MSTIIKIMQATKGTPVNEQAFTMHVMAPGQVIAITDAPLMDTNNPAANTKEAMNMALYRQQLVITSPAHEPMRLPITGNVYVMNEDGKTLSVYNVSMPLVADYQQAQVTAALNSSLAADSVTNNTESSTTAEETPEVPGVTVIKRNDNWPTVGTAAEM